MVVGDIAAGFSRMSSFRPTPRSSSVDGPHGGHKGGTMKSFMDGIMSPLVSCWQPPINSCVPGCGPYQHTRHYPSDSSIVSPMAERERQPPLSYPPHPNSPRSANYRPGSSEGAPIPSTVPSSPSSQYPNSATSTPRVLTNIEQPHSNDVLCGRGGSSNRHLGNMHFRELVAANKKTYVGLTKKQKMLVARKIVEMVHQAEPPGRFLSKDLDTGLWYDIGLPRSLEKTSQALREKNSNDVPDFHDDAALADIPSSPTITAATPAPANKEESSNIAAPSSTTSSSKTKSSKNVEAPPIMVPPHLRDIFGPRIQHQPHHHYPQEHHYYHHPPHHPPNGSWPDYPPSSSSASRQLSEPSYTTSYPPTPSSPAGASSASGGGADSCQHHHHSVSTPTSYSSYHRYGDVSPSPHSSSPSSPSSYHHGQPDRRDHYGEHYHPSNRPDRRDHYVTPPRPVDHHGSGSSSSWGTRLPPPPPPGAPPPYYHHHHHPRGHLPAPPASSAHHRPPPPSSHHQYHTHGPPQSVPPPPSHHHRPPVHPAPPASHHYRGHAASPVSHQPHPSSSASSLASPRSMQSSAPASPVSNASTNSYDYDYDHYLNSRHHQYHANHHLHHPPSLMDRTTPGVRSKAEVSPERRQEWKRQRNSEGTVRRLSESSLSRAMENRLSLDEHAAAAGGGGGGSGREQLHSTTSSTSDPRDHSTERVVMGHRELLQHHRAAGHAAIPTSSTMVEAPGTREIMSPSRVLQSRDRRSQPLIDLSKEADTAPVSSPSVPATSKATTSGVDRLAGLAALSTAAFLKMDQSD